MFPKIPWYTEKIIKHLPFELKKKIKLGGLKFIFYNPYEFKHTYKDIFNDEIYKFKSATEYPLIIDGGANIGLSSLYFKYLYPKSNLICFEADPICFQRLTNNMKVNGFDDTTLLQKAIWINDNGVAFRSIGSEGSRIDENDFVNTKIVPSISFSKYLNQFDKIDFLKLDIEGAEFNVCTAEDFPFHKIQNFFLEYHGKSNELYKLNKLLKIIEENNFYIYIQNAADRLKQPFYNKITNEGSDNQLNIYCYK